MHQYAQPVFENEDTDGDCEASHMECPACGCRDIVFIGPTQIGPQSVVIPMRCAANHTFDFILEQEDGEMIARCRVYPWPDK